MNSQKSTLESSPNWRAARPATEKRDGIWGITSGLSFAEFALRSGLMAPRLLGFSARRPANTARGSALARPLAEARLSCRPGED